MFDNAQSRYDDLLPDEYWREEIDEPLDSDDLLDAAYQYIQLGIEQRDKNIEQFDDTFAPLPEFLERVEFWYKNKV